MTNKQTVYLIRHGEVEGNILLLDRMVTTDQFNQIVDDVPHERLNATGIMQIKTAAETLADCQMACLYCSPLVRARQSANILAQHLNLPIIIRDDLFELLPARLSNDPKQIFTLKRAYIRSGLRLGNPFTRDTETAIQALIRIRNAFENLTRENRANFGIVGHQGIFRLLFLWIHLTPSWELMQGDTTNGGISIIRRRW